MAWKRPEHQVIAEALGAMDAGWLLANRCFFGGGTAIVMRNGEYRRSLDVDFLCADPDGYRDMRETAAVRGIAGFFGPDAETLREIRADRYGIRGVLGWRGQAIKFEIVREDRIPLDGAIDGLLAVPVLSVESQLAEKLLANADRWADPATSCRDAFDLGVLTIGLGGRIPHVAKNRAEKAYGHTIGVGVERVVDRLSDPGVRAQAATTLEMDAGDATNAIASLRDAAAKAWQDIGFAEIQSATRSWDFG